MYYFHFFLPKEHLKKQYDPYPIKVIQKIKNNSRIRSIKFDIECKSKVVRINKYEFVVQYLMKK